MVSITRSIVPRSVAGANAPVPAVELDAAQTHTHTQ